MSGEILQLLGIDGDDYLLANQIGTQYSKWHTNRAPYMDVMTEVHEYVQATDVSSTSNNSNGWNNSTHIPKITQIRDNLYANYQTGLFPNDNWLRWQYDGKIPAEATKKSVIEGYMRNKVRNEEFRNTINQLIMDYIDYGNVYAMAEYVKYTRTNHDGEEEIIFEGPVPRRIDPNDIVYNPLAATWKDTPVIIKSTMTEGDFVNWGEMQSDDVKAGIKSIIDMRNKSRSDSYSSEDQKKMETIELAGLGNMHEYLAGNTIEVLTFYGDWYDSLEGVLYKNKKIIVVDRLHVLVNEDNPSWVGKPVVHCSWRKRTNSLLGMSVLENLLGMQYRINHLENMKADVLDLNVYPPFKIMGNVPEFAYGPGQQIHIPNPMEGDDVQRITPDVSVIQVDLEIQTIMDWMEEFAGAPKETMGFRTPGEKTAFEVQQLMTGAGRVFQDKITNFEISVLEPLLNLMLSEARNGLNGSDLALVFNDLTQASTFTEVTASDIKTSGKIHPIGARHFSEQAQTLQNLVGVLSSPVGAKLLPHMSGKDLYTMLEDTMSLQKFGLFKENAGIEEQLEQQQVAREGMARNNQVAGTELDSNE